MSKLYNRLKFLGFDDDDFQLIDKADGNGPIILKWKSATRQPTQQELDAVNDAEADSKIEDDNFDRYINKSRQIRLLIKWIASLHNLSDSQAKTQLKNLWSGVR